MSDLPSHHLETVGYHTWPEEKKRAYEAKMKDLGYVIGPPQMERVADRFLRGNSRETLEALYGE